jgi:hypothetical protein
MSDFMLDETIPVPPTYRPIADLRESQINTTITYCKRSTEIEFVDGELTIRCHQNNPPMARGELKELWRKYSGRGFVASIIPRLRSRIHQT